MLAKAGGVVGSRALLSPKTLGRRAALREAGRCPDAEECQQVSLPTSLGSTTPRSGRRTSVRQNRYIGRHLRRSVPRSWCVAQ